MQSTPNYLWELENLLGQGATASVYKARNKKTGEEVAVKVFNNLSCERPHEVQMRKFEMLRKLNHVNIVKLFAVEEIGSTKQKVLVMEYCSSGSLLSVLEEPENAFGLSESEFLIVMQCVVAGMNHLRQNGVVHRDIKPGNIMRLIGEDGHSIYKLTDFGAARELDDDEKFQSIYGTEEYLHPDMYERAVLRKPQQKSYGVTVDLWSIGVTFYHAATGNLPFIPFGGPRKNKVTMHKITTEKPPGTIAGVQRKENGAIEWIYELPVNCQLSVALKTHVESILPNILEADQEKCWGFDKFFSETNKILERMAIHVFSLPQANMHKIYVHPCDTVAKFMEIVSIYTLVPPERQRYLYEGHHFPINPAMEVCSLSTTTEQNPFILIGSEIQEPKSVIYKDPATDYPRFLPSVNVVGDYTIAKEMFNFWLHYMSRFDTFEVNMLQDEGYDPRATNVLAAVYQTIRVSKSLLRCQEFIPRGTYWLIQSMKTECRRIADKKGALVPILNCMANIENRTQRLCKKGNSEATEMYDQGESHWKLHSMGNILSRFSQCLDKENMLGRILLDVLKEQDQFRMGTSINRMENCLQKMQLIFRQFKKRRQQPRLGYNEEQIHKLDKVNLGNLAKKVLSIFQDEVALMYQTALSEHAAKMRAINEIQNHLGLINGYLIECFREFRSYEESVNKAMDSLSERMLQVYPVHSNHSPQASYPNDTQDDLTLRILQLRDEMKAVTYELEQNNSIIDRLSVSSSSPGL